MKVLVTGATGFLGKYVVKELVTEGYFVRAFGRNEAVGQSLVSASAVGVQPIPCTAALIHERVAKDLTIPAMDINTTCTSFISALSTISYLIEGVASTSVSSLCPVK